MPRTDSSTTIAQVLLWIAIIGALNWGLVGLFNFDLVRAIFGGETTTDAGAASRAIYAIVGIAGAALAFFAPRLRAAARTTATTPETHAEVRA